MDPNLSSKKPAMVSVAICTYNGEKFIAEQIESILKQTHTHFEIVVSDDGSKDKTLEIIRLFNDDRIRIFVNAVNLGLEGNTQRAISLCEGEFIALADQDDIWLPHKLETLIKNIGDSQLIYADSEFCDNGGVPSGKKLSQIRKMFQGDDNRVFSIPFISCLYGHAILFKSNLRAHLFPFPPKFHDAWIGFIATSIGSIRYLDEVLVHYRQHEFSTTHNSSGSEKSSLNAHLLPWFLALSQSSENKHSNFFNRLVYLFHNSQQKKITILLFLFLLKFRNVLFFTKPNFFSRINLIRKIIRR